MSNFDFRNLPIYKQIISKTNTIAETIGLDDLSTNQLRDFVVDTAHHQYQAGNKAGIAWVHGGMKKTVRAA